jgi:hypothetical protein
MTAKKVAKKRAATRKKPEQTLFEMLEDSLIGQPFIIANKVFLASLGLVSTIQTEFSSKFDEYVKDGEVVRDKYQASFSKLQEDVVKRAGAAKDRVVESIEPKAAA